MQDVTCYKAGGETFVCILYVTFKPFISGLHLNFVY